jgi:CRISPR type IV-associated DEAD/DEAH-box helicase Csf4
MVASHLLQLRISGSRDTELIELKRANRDLLTSLFSQLSLFPKGSDEHKNILREISEIKNAQDVNTIHAADGSGLLPEFGHLFIDEAHAMDDSMDLVFNSRISVMACYRALKTLSEQGVCTKASVTQARKHLDNLIGLCGDTVGEKLQLYGDSNESRDASHSALMFAETCLAGIKKSKRNSSPSAALLESDCRTLIRMKDSVQKYQRRAYLDHSPVAKYPRFTIKKRSLNLEYKLLWHNCSTASLVSAVLYTRKLSGESSLYIRKKSNMLRQIPKERQKSK